MIWRFFQSLNHQIIRGSKVLLDSEFPQNLSFAINLINCFDCDNDHDYDNDYDSDCDREHTLLNTYDLSPFRKAGVFL
jgi:hypothetical protein